ncbi:MAG: EcsC family protein [Eubacteriales bacterium]|nr:EcsC family protein [Eubacteriales bacterium]
MGIKNLADKKLGKVVSDIGRGSTGIASELGRKSAQVAGAVGKKSLDAANFASDKVTDLATKAKDGTIRTKDTIVEKLDVNIDGKIDIEDIIILGMRTPGVKISREEFLRKELSKNYSEEVIADVISYNPAHAGISVEEIDKLADEVIKLERICVSGISTVLGAPGGAAMAVTIPADITQYYGYMLRATQKLLYLYGFPEIDAGDNGQTFDSETMNILILCMGVMYGAAGANNAIKGIAKALASGVEKQLMKKALTKGTIYPVVKSVSKWFSVKMTKEVFAGFFKKAIPVVGGVIGGGLTYATFKPCCDKLKKSLRETKLANPNIQDEDGIVIDNIDEEVDNSTELIM